MYPQQNSAIFHPLDITGTIARISAIEASTKAGKTVGCIFWLTEQALLNGKPGRNFWWIAPIRAQAKIAFDRFKLYAPKWAFSANESELSLSIINGAKIWFKSADNPDSLYGEDVYAAVIDEASRMVEAAWVAIQSTLTATFGPVRIIGNVKGRRNWFYEIARRAEKGERDLSYHRITWVEAAKANVLDERAVQAAKANMSEQTWRELFLAIPSDDGGNPFGQKNIEDCSTLDYQLSGTGEPVAWGWDLAKSVDWTVGIALDRCGHVWRFHRFQIDWGQTRMRIRSATGNQPALVDSTGVGDPVLEDLQRFDEKRGSGSNFEGYHFHPSSKQKLMEGLAAAIHQRKVRFAPTRKPTSIDDVAHIAFELELFEYEFTAHGVRYSAPEGYHDDCVVALALAWQCFDHQSAGLAIWQALGRA